MGPAPLALGIPRRVLLTSAALTVVLVIPFGAVLWFFGVPAAIALGLGFLTGTRPATTSLPAGTAAALSLPAALAGAVAVSLRAEPFSAACFVALCCLMIAPAEIWRQGLLTGLPTAAVVLVAAPGDFHPLTTAWWMLVGSLLLVAIATMGRFPRQQTGGTRPSAAWRHAIVMAASVGLVTFAVQQQNVPHGYWVAVTLTMVLRPLPAESRTKARQRTLGTVAGVVLSLGLAWLLPPWGVGIALALCLMLMIAYALVDDYARQMIFLTPAVVLLAPAGGVGTVATERAVATLLGTLLAGAVALLLERSDYHTWSHP